MSKNWEPPINIYDPYAFFGDIYLLNYCDILVFFQICDVKAETVKVVELATYPYENGVMLYRDLRVSKKPYFVKRNVRSKSDYEITLEEGMEESLPIWIDCDSTIYKEAVANRTYLPATGVFYAEKISKALDTYFVAAELEEQIEVEEIEEEVFEA